MMPYKDPEVGRRKHAEYLRQRYQADAEFRDKHKRHVKGTKHKYDKENSRLIENFKASGCLVCGETDPCCMSAHHLDPATKRWPIGAVKNGTNSPNSVAEELAKCVCVCENCHRKIHAGRFSLLR